MSVASRRPGLALGVLAGAQFLVVLNASSVNLAVPGITGDLHLSPSLAVWVVSAYLLTFGGLLLTGGRLGDLVGRRRLFTIGTAAFGAASLIGALAPDGAVLIAARLLQGASAAALAPTALALLTASFPDPVARRRAIGVWGAVASSGGAAGVLIGGALTTVWGWRSVLALNVPLAMVLLALVPAALLASTSQPAKVNSLSTAMSFLGIAALIAGLTLGGDQGWLSPVTLTSLIAGVLILTVFVVTERRGHNPLIPLHLLARWPGVGGDIMIFVAGFALYPAMLFLSLTLQGELGFAPVTAGLMLLPLSAATVLSALLTPRLISRAGVTTVAAVGLGALVVATVALAVTVASGSPLVAFVACILVFGAGLGATVTASTNLALSAAAPQESGAASGLLQTAQQLGGAIGLTVATTIAGATASGLAAEGTVVAVDLGRGAALVVAAVIALSGLLLATIGFSRASRPRPDPHITSRTESAGAR